MNRTGKVGFYGSLIFLYFSDLTLMIAVLWWSYRVTSSPLFLSIIFSVGILLPIIINRITGKVNILAMGLQKLMLFRIALYILCAVCAVFLGESVAGFTLLAVLLGLLSVSILSTYETQNTLLVLHGEMDADKASRIMQTVIQVGAFVGALIGTQLLERYGFLKTIILVAVFDIVVCTVLFFLFAQAAKPSHTSPQPKQVGQNSGSLPAAVYILCVALGCIGLHIATFNLTVPIIFQHINDWQAADFGIASGFSGLGALCAVLFRQRISRLLGFVLLLVLTDLLFTFNSYVFMVAPLCFIIGFCMNSLRIAVRKGLMSLAANDDDAVRIGTLSSVCYLFLQAGGSVLMGLVMSYTAIGTRAAPWLLAMVALCLLPLLWFVYPRLKEQHE